MKCLVFSDTHGSLATVRRAMSMHPDCEAVFFLGDGIRDLEAIAVTRRDVFFVAVRGNCDTSAYFRSEELKKVESITLLGKKIVLTHGDLYGAKGGYGGLIALGRKSECDLVLFGHTHIPTEYYDSESSLYLFNPGSLRYDRTYGYVDIVGDSLITAVVELR